MNNLTKLRKKITQKQAEAKRLAGMAKIKKLDEVCTLVREARGLAVTSFKICRTCPKCRHRLYHWVSLKTSIAICTDCGYEWKVRITIDEQPSHNRDFIL